MNEKPQLEPQINTSGIPEVSDQTIQTLRADIMSGRHSTKEWAKIIATEQPALYKLMESLASGHNERAPEVFRELVIMYMAVRKQSRANFLNSTLK